MSNEIIEEGYTEIIKSISNEIKSKMFWNNNSEFSNTQFSKYKICIINQKQFKILGNGFVDLCVESLKNSKLDFDLILMPMNGRVYCDYYASEDEKFNYIGIDNYGINKFTILNDGLQYNYDTLSYKYNKLKITEAKLYRTYLKSDYYKILYKDEKIEEINGNIICRQKIKTSKLTFIKNVHIKDELSYMGYFIDVYMRSFKKASKFNKKMLNLKMKSYDEL